MYSNVLPSEIVFSQGQSVESIRATFLEGERLFPDSAVFDLAHVQIAVRNPALIIRTDIMEI
jgi:hypothetical protein